MKRFLYYCLLFPHILAYVFSKNRNIIKADAIQRSRFRNYDYPSDTIAYICQILWREPEFRNVFYARVGRKRSFLLNVLLPNLKDMDLEGTDNIGAGFVLIHGHGTVVNKECIIGENCTLLHQVTIGESKGLSPVLGNNVYVGCGAIIIGGIHIGNNVKIGAGAVVVHDIPDNATVTGEPASIKRF